MLSHDPLGVRPKSPQASNLTFLSLHFGFLSAPKSQRFLRFAIAMPIADPRNRARFPRQETAMMHCDLRVRWKVASDLRFRAAISEPKTPSFCGISGDLAQSTRKSLAIAIVRFWMRANASKRRQTRTNASKRRGANASKREQT